MGCDYPRYQFPGTTTLWNSCTYGIIFDQKLKVFHRLQLVRLEDRWLGCGIADEVLRSCGSGQWHILTDAAAVREHGPDSTYQFAVSECSHGAGILPTVDLEFVNLLFLSKLIINDEQRRTSSSSAGIAFFYTI